MEKVCERLTRPSIEHLDSSAAEVESAVACLQRLESGLLAGSRPAGWPQLVAEVRSIEREVLRAQALVDAAGQFYAGLARMAAAGADNAAANYTASGKPDSRRGIHVAEVTVDG
jgi:hypothetical protein